MSFQKIVLTIATILLIIILVMIGISLSRASETDNWPPIVGKCPDFWVDISGNGESCFNTHNLGTCNISSETNKNTKNFNEVPFKGVNGDCYKYKWAKQCNVTWDGITSGVINPCDETSKQQ